VESKASWISRGCSRDELEHPCKTLSCLSQALREISQGFYKRFQESKNVRLTVESRQITRGKEQSNLDGMISESFTYTE